MKKSLSPEERNRAKSGNLAKQKLNGITVLTVRYQCRSKQGR